MGAETDDVVVRGADEVADAGTGRRGDRYVIPLAVAGTLAVLISNLGGLASGDDGVGYRAIADSLLAGEGLRYFLEDPLTVWPPLWPALMAGIAAVTPLDTIGAAILLNAAMTFAAVVVGHRLLRRLVDDDRLVLLGTAVIALGSSTIGFGHLLMTDFAFAVVVMLWILALVNHQESGRMWWLLGAAALVWAGFGLRYVAIVLIATGGLWLLLDGRRRISLRVRDAAVYGVVASLVPVGWMLRNHALDGTWTGPRYPSARGPVDNGFDIAATLGRFLMPGVLNGLTKVWAAVGILVLGGAAVLAWRALAARRGTDGPVPRQVVRLLGRPSGLLLLQAGLYLTYMLYIRSTTALNQLDLRLLNPAYLPLMVLALALVARLRAVPPPGRSPEFRIGWATAHVWAVVNVVLGIVAVVAFALGNAFFPGNFESDTFIEIRDDPALDAVPAGCDVVSNQPNGLYPRLEADWSPRRTGLESEEPVDDLDELIAELDTRRVCLVWVEEDPDWGHLWSLEELQQQLTLRRLAGGGTVTVYEVTPAS